MKKLIVLMLILTTIIGVAVLTGKYYHYPGSDKNIVASTNNNAVSPANKNPDSSANIANNISNDKEVIDSEHKTNEEQTMPAVAPGEFQYYEIFGQSNQLSRTQQSNLDVWRKEVQMLANNNADKVFLNGSVSEKKVALTFDDGPDAKFTPQIIDILNQNQVKGNFFFSGNRIPAFPEVVKKADRSGHLVLNHTQNHVQLNSKTAQLINEEVLLTDQAIFNIIGKHPALVRPPYGAINRTVIDELNKNHYLIIIWSTDTMDWSQRDAANITKNVLDNVRPGEIILMHSNGNREATVKALPLIIAGLQQEGYEIVGLDELLQVSACK